MNKFGEKIRAAGYKDIDEFFRKNSLAPFTVLAEEIGSCYQTVSRHYKEWAKRCPKKAVQDPEQLWAPSEYADRLSRMTKKVT